MAFSKNPVQWSREGKHIANNGRYELFEPVIALSGDGPEMYSGSSSRVWDDSMTIFVQPGQRPAYSAIRVRGSFVVGGSAAPNITLCINKTDGTWYDTANNVHDSNHFSNWGAGGDSYNTPDGHNCSGNYIYLNSETNTGYRVGQNEAVLIDVAIYKKANDPTACAVFAEVSGAHGSAFVRQNTILTLWYLPIENIKGVQLKQSDGKLIGGRITLEVW